MLAANRTLLQQSDMGKPFQCHPSSMQWACARFSLPVVCQSSAPLQSMQESSSVAWWLQDLPLDRKLKRLYLVSVAQFRPEKDHALQLHAYAYARQAAVGRSSPSGELVVLAV